MNTHIVVLFGFVLCILYLSSPSEGAPSKRDLEDVIQANAAREYELDPSIYHDKRLYYKRKPQGSDTETDEQKRLYYKRLYYKRAHDEDTNNEQKRLYYKRNHEVDDADVKRLYYKRDPDKRLYYKRGLDSVQRFGQKAVLQAKERGRTGADAAGVSKS